jgi:hypothetical protein
MGAQRARHLAIGFIVAIVLSIAAGRMATRGDGLAAAAADLRSTASSTLAVTLPSALQTFVAVTPCRVADTRGDGFTGQYGPPSIGAGGVRTFTIEVTDEPWPSAPIVKTVQRCSSVAKRLTE